MHSLHAPIYSIAVALSLATSLPAASSQAKPTPAKPADPIEHKVAKGETLWSISQKHQTSIGDIMTRNKLSSDNVREGMILKIPPRVAVTPTTAPASTARPATTRELIHVVKGGETFWSIAEKYKINPQALAEANPNINPNRLHPDMEVIVPSAQLAATAQKTTPAAPAKPAAPKPGPAPTISSGSAQQHTLAEGETFYSLGKKYNVKLDAIVAANSHLKPERLAPGTKVNIPRHGQVAAAPATSAGSKQTAATSTKPKPAEPEVKRHTVKDGDSIASIAQRYALQPETLLKQNNLVAGDPIYIGDVLTIPSTSQPAPKKPEISNTSKPATSPSAQKTAGAPTPATKTETVAKAPESASQKTKPNLIEVAEDGSVRSYTVSFGETEDTICEAFGITKKELFEHNKLGQGAKLRPGDEIMIPATTKKIVSR